MKRHHPIPEFEFARKVMSRPLKTYTGKRDAGGARVERNGRPFTAARSLKVRNHSPTGFEWGYGGSGPAQLALALLLDNCDKETALALYQRFKFEKIGGLNRDQWSMTSDDIVEWVKVTASRAVKLYRRKNGILVGHTGREITSEDVARILDEE